MNKVRTIHALAAATVSSNSGVIDNPEAYAGTFFIDVSGVTGTLPTLQVTIEGVDTETGAAFTILQSAVLNSAGLTVLKVGPGLTAAANLVANDQLPKQIRFQFVIGGSAGQSVTFAVSASLRS